MTRYEELIASGRQFGTELNDACKEKGIELDQDLLGHYISAFLATCKEKGFPKKATRQEAVRVAVRLIEDGLTGDP